mgnify:FL=1
MADCEALVAAVQRGDREKLPELWDCVRAFAARQAYARMAAYRATQTDCAVDAEDLMQEAFLAMLRALETYQGGGGMSFLGWWKMYLRKAFNGALGMLRSASRCDPVRRCESLHRPVGEGGELLGDLLEDRENPVEELERALWREELRRALRLALEELPGSNREMVVRRYCQGVKLRQIAAEAGTSTQAVSETTRRTLKTLRKNDTAGRLAEFARQI